MSSSFLRLRSRTVPIPIDPRFVAIGANNGIYISDANRGVSLNLVTIVGPATTGITRALAFGGTSGGVANQEVLYFGDANGNLYLRTAAAG